MWDFPFYFFFIDSLYPITPTSQYALGEAYFKELDKISNSKEPASDSVSVFSSFLFVMPFFAPCGEPLAMHLQWLGGRLDQNNSSLLVEACEQLSLPAYLSATLIDSLIR